MPLTYQPYEERQIEMFESNRRKNVHLYERIASAAIGAVLVGFAVRQKPLAAIGLAAAGIALLQRGATGHCSVKAAAQRQWHARQAGVRGGGIRVEQLISINRPPEEVFSFWRQLDNLPRFMGHLEAVEESGERFSHWVAKGPAGSSVEWDAEIINERENELIAWQSLPGANVANAGSVRFEPLDGGRATEVKVALEYQPPAGALGSAVAKLFGEEPAQQIRDDLRKLKQLLEVGELATIEGQTSGRAPFPRL
jgi:uncharacterized membrane protein